MNVTVPWLGSCVTLYSVKVISANLSAFDDEGRNF